MTVKKPDLPVSGHATSAFISLRSDSIMSTTEPVDTPAPTNARPQYDEYEDSGVEWLDEIPAHWKTARLRFLLETSPSKTEIRDLPDTTEVSFVPMESVKENGGLDLSETKEIEEVVDGYTYFRDGDVLVAKITPCFENRKGALASDLTNGIGFGTTELHVLRPGSDLDERFLYYMTMSHPFRKIGESTMYGAGGQKRVSNDFVENLRWPVPPPTEQDAIATFLDRETECIDALIEKKERLIDLLEEKRTAFISHAVTKGLDENVEMRESGVRWIGEIPEHWESPKVRYLCSVKRGASPRPIEDPKYFDEDGRYSWVRISDVTKSDHHLYETEQTLSAEGKSESVPVEPDELLISIAATVGKPIITKIKCCIHDGFVHLSSLEGSKDFYYYVFSGGEIYKGIGKQGTQLNLNTDSVGNLRVPVPPIEEQHEIASHLDRETERLDTLASRAKEAIGRLKEYRTALISAAVTGQIDVRKEVGTTPIE